MKELVPLMNDWISQSKNFVLARVIQTWGSSPRPVGSAMLIANDMEMAGSVSGGCVEGSVLRKAKEIFSNESTNVLDVGVSDEEAWAVGLTCGGKISVYIQPYPKLPLEAAVWQKWNSLVNNNQSCALISDLSAGQTLTALIDSSGNFMGNSFPANVVSMAKDFFMHRKSTTFSDAGKDYFVHVFPAKSKLIMIGASNITSDLVLLAKRYDFETIVIDPRGTFARNTHYPEGPDVIVEKYPSEVLHEFKLDHQTFSVILSHDPKIDDNALHILLRSGVAYIGALGSRKTHEKRAQRLLAAGFSQDEINRIESPIGLDIHAEGAREIALSIMASLIKVKNS